MSARPPEWEIAPWVYTGAVVCAVALVPFMTTISVINLMDGHIIVALMALGPSDLGRGQLPKAIEGPQAEFRKP